MGAPQASPETKKMYRHWRFEMQMTQKAAAARVGMSESWAKAYERGLNNTSGGEYRRQKAQESIPGAKHRHELDPIALDCLDDFERWRVRYTGHLSTPWQIETAQMIVDLSATPDKEYVVENVCPGTGKTTLKRDIAAWLTCRDRSLRGQFGSRVEGTAVKDLKALRRMLERTTPPKAKDDDRERGLAVDAVACMAVEYGAFKPAQLDTWRNEEFIVAQLDDEMIVEKEATWSAYGMDSSFIGLRYKYVFWDDVVDKTTVRTGDAIEGQRTWWDDDGETRLEPGGLMWLIGQRYHPQDLYRYCLNKTIEDDREDDEIPEGEERKPEIPVYQHIVYRAHDESKCSPENHRKDAPAWPEGCLLDPKRVPYRGKGGINDMTRNKPRTFQIQYQQEDVDPDDTLCKEVWLTGGIDPETSELAPGCWDHNRDICELPKGLNGIHKSIATIDPSATKMWAVQWWIDTPEASSQSWLMDTERKAMELPDILAEDPNTGQFSGIMEEWQQRSVQLGHPIHHWIIEANAAHRYLLQQALVHRWMQSRNVTIIAHNTTGKKKWDEERGPWSMRDHFRMGRIRLPGKQHGDALGRVHSLRFTNEATHWPNGGGTTDQVMAASFFFWHKDNLFPPQQEDVYLHRPSWARAA